MKIKFIQVATLTFFIVLIVSFVAYRSGVLVEFAQPGLTERALTFIQSDTLPKTDSTKNKVLMPSSKSLILTDEKIRSSAIQFDPQFHPDSTEQKRLEIMGSSKSGIIFKTKDKPKSKANLADSTDRLK